MSLYPVKELDFDPERKVEFYMHLLEFGLLYGIRSQIKHTKAGVP